MNVTPREKAGEKKAIMIIGWLKGVCGSVEDIRKFLIFLMHFK